MEITELDKWGNHLPLREIIEEFLVMLQEKEIYLGEYSKEYESLMVPTMSMKDDLLDEFFDINRNQLEKERRELLLECTSSQNNDSVRIEK